jgi:vacuolar-type H+-ATPase subunit F/Vma7
MALFALIGDEVSASGFRLAGVQVHVPDPARTADLFRRLIREAELVLVTAEAAEQLPADELRRALSADRPLVLVIPDVRGRVQPADIGSELRRQLGMSE